MRGRTPSPIDVGRDRREDRDGGGDRPPGGPPRSGLTNTAIPRNQRQRLLQLEPAEDLAEDGARSVARGHARRSPAPPDHRQGSADTGPSEPDRERRRQAARCKPRPLFSPAMSRRFRWALAESSPWRPRSSSSAGSLLLWSRRDPAGLLAPRHLEFFWHSLRFDGFHPQADCMIDALEQLHPSDAMRKLPARYSGDAGRVRRPPRQARGAGRRPRGSRAARGRALSRALLAGAAAGLAFALRDGPRALGAGRVPRAPSCAWRPLPRLPRHRLALYMAALVLGLAGLASSRGRRRPEPGAARRPGVLLL